MPSFRRHERVLFRNIKTAPDEFKTSGAVFISGDKTYRMFLSAAVKMLSRSAAMFNGKRFKGKDSPYRNRLSVTAANIPATRHTKADSDNTGQGLQILAQGK